jgi:DNA-binding NtrC family response regulator
VASLGLLGVEWYLQPPSRMSVDTELAIHALTSPEPSDRGAGGKSPGANRDMGPAVPAADLAGELAAFVHHATNKGQNAPISLKDWRDVAEAWRISQALRSCAGNRSAAARELGIGRRTLYAKMEKLGIEPRW